ncbi:Protein of unknown function [Gryllus bimaculatus]|nr:Protein of unknown function [Gryllus bimaculatus]
MRMHWPPWKLEASIGHCTGSLDATFVSKGEIPSFCSSEEQAA